MVLHATSSKDGAGLLDGLCEDTEGIVEGALSLVEDLLGRTTQDNGACLTKGYPTESKKLSR